MELERTTTTLSYADTGNLTRAAAVKRKGHTGFVFFPLHSLSSYPSRYYAAARDIESNFVCVQPEQAGFLLKQSQTAG